MALKSQKNNNTQVSFPSTTQNLPILLFDIMDTIVRDPFYHDVPAFFRYPNPLSSYWIELGCVCFLVHKIRGKKKNSWWSIFIAFKVQTFIMIH